MILLEFHVRNPEKWGNTKQTPGLKTSQEINSSQLVYS